MNERPHAGRGLRGAPALLLWAAASASACATVVLLGALSGPEFTGPRGREAGWIFLAALAAFAVLPPAAASLSWTRRRQSSSAGAWAASAVLLWNLCWIGIFGASTRSVFSDVAGRRGGWAVRQVTGPRSVPREEPPAARGAGGATEPRASALRPARSSGGNDFRGTTTSTREPSAWTAGPR